MNAPLSDYKPSVGRDWAAAVKYNDITWMRRILGVTALSNLISGMMDQGSAIRYVSANYQVTADDNTLLVDSSGGPISITLPVGSEHPGQRVTVIRVGAMGNIVTLLAKAGDAINGSSSFQLINDYASVSVRLSPVVAGNPGGHAISATYNTGI